MLVSPIFSLIVGIAMGKQHGVWYGILSGIGSLFVSVIIAVLLANSKAKLTVSDCIIPTILSFISGIVFAPVQLLAGSVFSAATCIFSGILLSTGMLLYKNGRMAGWALTLPALTFLYEMLPIELPTDMDNIFAFGGSLCLLFLGRIKESVEEKQDKPLLEESNENDIIDVSDESKR